MNAKHGTRVVRAVNFAFESLEGRRLLSVGGLPTATAGMNYALHLDPAGRAVSGWSIDLGDGQTSSAGATDAAATHPYLTPGTFRPVATATYSDNTTRLEALGLDPTFGPASSSGKTTADLGSFDGAKALARQADGKVIAAGYRGFGWQGDFGLARFNPDGSLDASFGTGGVVDSPFYHADA